MSNKVHLILCFTNLWVLKLLFNLLLIWLPFIHVFFFCICILNAYICCILFVLNNMACMYIHLRNYERENNFFFISICTFGEIWISWRQIRFYSNTLTLRKIIFWSIKWKIRKKISMIWVIFLRVFTKKKNYRKIKWNSIKNRNECM